MYIFKNSLKNLVRNKGRNITILLISFLTLISVTLSFSIQTLSDIAIEYYRKSFGVQAKLEIDWEKLSNEHPPEKTVNEDGSITMESNYEIPSPDVEEYARYADSSYVKQVLYYASCAIASDSLIPVADNLQQDEEVIDISGMSREELKRFFNVSTDEELEETLGGKEEVEKIMDTKKGCIGSLVGFTDISLLEDFTTGRRKLEQGNFPQKDNECIISTEFAKQNDLKVGDSIFISGQSASLDQEEREFTITGLYGDYFNAVTAAELGLFYGDIFTTYDTLMDSGFHYIELLDAVFILNDPESAKLFEQELYNKGMNEYYTLSYSIDEYENNTRPLKNISRIAEIFTLSAGVVGAAIILLISSLNARERKYEIGVLRSMGMKKADIARGMIYETLIIMLVGFICSTLGGFILTKPVASVLIDNAINVEIALPAAAVLFSAVMAFVLSIISGLCAVFFVMRHEPMKILSERN